MTLDPTLYEITDGYVGTFGKTFKTATTETLTNAISKAAEMQSMTVAAVEAELASGRSVKWCKSPNYYYDHSEGIIRRKPTAKPAPALVRCSCGHSVPQKQVMSASLGTSCPDCYDRMSD